MYTDNILKSVDYPDTLSQLLSNIQTGRFHQPNDLQYNI